MHKISIQDDKIGKLEWTPPDVLQEHLDTISTETSAEMKKWMGACLNVTSVSLSPPCFLLKGVHG